MTSMSLGFDFPGLVKRPIDEDGWPADLPLRSRWRLPRHVRMFDALIQMLRSRQPFDHGTVVVAATATRATARSTRTMRSARRCPPPPRDDLDRRAGGVPERAQVPRFSNTFPQISAPE